MQIKILFFLIFLVPFAVLGLAEKEVNQKLQTWVSINTVTKFSDHWGFIADAHIRAEGVFEENNFYFLI